MTKQEYDELQNNLSSLLEKKDINGRKIRRSQDYENAVMAAKSVLHSWFMYHNKENESEYRLDENKHKTHSVPIADGICFVAEMGDIMHDTLKYGGVEQAKRMHWGTYCRSFEMCHASGLCEIVCPGGGVGAMEER